MKKLMMMLAALAVSVPFMSASAIEITNCAVSDSCYTYTAGQEVNFYKNEEEANSGSTDAGITTIVLEDNGSSSQYVRALSTTPYGGSEVYYDPSSEDEPMTLVKKSNRSYIEQQAGTLESVQTDADSNIIIDYITLDELKTVFGATENADGTYTIDADKWADTFEIFAVGKYASEGFYTSTYDIDTNKVWVVAFTWTGENTTSDIDTITVKQVDMNTNTYGYLAVMNFNKTYDCTERTTTETYACYVCEEEYVWTKVGSQADTCTLADTITTKANCVKTPKTGVEDYIVEFVGVAFVCGVALVIAKKKDLFRSI